jgi:hypothetical protein
MTLPIISNMWADQVSDYDAGVVALRLGGGKIHTAATQDGVRRIFTLTSDPAAVSEVKAVHDLMMATRFGLRDFLIKDHLDFTVEDEPLGFGGGSPLETEFVPIKTYAADSGDPIVRTIRHFDEDSLVVRVDGQIVPAFRSEEGTIVITSPPADEGQLITWSVNPFYVRCKLVGTFSIRMAAEWQAGEIPNVASIPSLICEEML